MQHRHGTPIHLEDACPDGKIGNLVCDFLLRITKDSSGQLAGEGLARELSVVGPIIFLVELSGVSCSNHDQSTGKYKD